MIVLIASVVVSFEGTVYDTAVASVDSTTRLTSASTNVQFPAWNTFGQELLTPGPARANGADFLDIQRGRCGALRLLTRRPRHGAHDTHP